MSQAIESTTFSTRPDQSHILYDGIDVTIFTPEGPNLRDTWNLNDQAYVIGLASRLDPWKGILEFLEAIPPLCEAIPHAHVVISGGEIEGHAEYARKIRERCSAEDLLNRVTLTGWDHVGDSMADVFRSFNVFVNSSTSPEPFGMSIIEAMGCGVPVVSGRRGGPAEIITPETGCLIDNLSPQGFVEGLMNVYQRQPTAQACVDRVQELFLRDRSTRQFEQHVTAVMNR